MSIRVLGPVIASCLLAVAAATLASSPAFAYQELGCRRACLAAQYASMRRCASNCYTTREGAHWYCEHMCVGRGH